jgi:hypothetical protein
MLSKIKYLAFYEKIFRVLALAPCLLYAWYFLPLCMQYALEICWIHAKILIFVSGTAPRVKKTGEFCLEPEKTKTKHTSYLNTRTGHGPRRGGPRRPPEWPSQRPPRAGSASLEGSRLPRAGSASLEGSRLRLARGSLTSAPAPARWYGRLMLWHSRVAPSRAWESRPGAVPPTT